MNVTTMRLDDKLYLCVDGEAVAVALFGQDANLTTLVESIPRRRGPYKRGTQQHKLPKEGTKAREVLDEFLPGPRLRGSIDGTAIATLRRSGLIEAVEYVDTGEQGAHRGLYGLTEHARKLYAEVFPGLAEEGTP